MPTKPTFVLLAALLVAAGTAVVLGTGWLRPAADAHAAPAGWVSQAIPNLGLRLAAPAARAVPPVPGQAARPLPDFVRSLSTQRYELPQGISLSVTLTVVQPGYPINLETTAANATDRLRAAGTGCQLVESSCTQVSGAPAYRTVARCGRAGAPPALFRGYLITRHDSVWTLSAQHPDRPTTSRLARQVLASVQLL